MNTIQILQNETIVVVSDCDWFISITCQQPEGFTVLGNITVCIAEGLLCADVRFNWPHLTQK
jgi:hypothetical protein